MERLKQQIEFLKEVDKMKNVLRQTLLIDKSRQETDAEHSWHFALAAMLLFEHIDDKTVDLTRVLKMALVHDLIEIYAGDTFAYDEKGNADKAQREAAAADRLFQLLPEDQGIEYRKLWEEFDAMETPDAQYAASIDRLQPLINNYYTQGHTWKLGNVTSDKVYARVAVLKKSSQTLWELADFMIQDSIKQGWLKP